MKQYTIGDIMNIDAGRQTKAAQCQVNLIKTFHELKPETLIDRFRSTFLGKSIIKSYYVIFKFSITSDTGNAHTVFIKVNPDFDLQDWDKNKVKVYCDCADFKYRSAYELNKHSSLFLTDKIKLALGSAITDAPKGKIGTTLLCKHTFAALSWLVKNYTNIMKTI